MATDNKTLLQKVDLQLAQIAAGGLLQTQQVDEFVILAIRESMMLGDVSVSPMSGPVEERDKMRFAGRVLRAGTEATSLSLAERTAPTLSLFTMTSRLYRAEVRITDEVLEDQIERNTFKDTVLKEMAHAIGRDMEHVAVNGDVTTVVVGPDTALLASQDGWLRLAAVNLVAGGGAQLNPNLLRDALTTMPVEFRRARQALRFYTNDFAEIRYTDDNRGRQTPIGDGALSGTWTPNYQKIPVTGIPEFPDTLGVGLNQTAVLLTDPKNLAIGFQRQIKVETDRDVGAGITLLVASVRFAVAIVETQATVRIDAVAGR